jgi:signal transduction histidine kinase
VLRRGGESVQVEVAVIQGVFDGQPSRIHIVRDLTERKQLEARLLRSDRMASLGTLAAGVAHEINNPLAFMMANLDHLGAEVLPQLEDPPGARDEARRLVSETRLGAVRVRDIVRQLKLFSRDGEDSKPEPVDVHRVLETAIRMATNEIKHRARLVRDYGEPLVAEADEGRLGQVVLNLLVNAAQAIPEGHAEHHEIRLRTRPHPDGVLIEVRDTGMGIPAQHLERIFEPFFTTKPIGVGTGLGLSICHGIVTRLGGRMEVESAVGQGTTFRVLLRAPQAAPRAAQPAALAPAPTQTRRGRILVVDDEPLIGLAIRRILQRAHDVVTLTSAREARTRLLDGERFDVILCDLMMPEMSGMELHEELATRAPALAERVVFLTGGAFTSNARAFLSRVGNPRMEKPFSSEELNGMVRALLVEPPEPGPRPQHAGA